jgi:ABC-type phosphate/phosphonate transport system substrate-binding protein
VDFVLTQPAHYILLAQGQGLLSPLATLIEKYGDKPLPSIRGIIATRSDQNKIQNLADLAGKRIATSSKAELGGYMVQAYELAQRGFYSPTMQRSSKPVPPRTRQLPRCWPVRWMLPLCARA